MSLVANYRYRVMAHFVFYILATLFTILSIPAIIPLFEMLFQKQMPSFQAPDQIQGLGDFISLVKYRLAVWINQRDQNDALMLICGGLGLIFFFKNLFRYLAIYTMAPVRVGISAQLRQKLFNKWMNLPLSYFSEERKGDLISRMTTDVQEIEFSILSTLETLVKDPLLILGSLTIMIYTSPPLTLFVLVLMLFTSVVIGGISRTLRKQSSTAQHLMGDLISIQEESLGGLRVIKSFAAENYVIGRFNWVLDVYRNMVIKIHRRRDLSSPLSEFLGITVVCFLLWYGAKLVFADEMAGSVFIAFLYAFFNVIEPSKALSNAYFNIQKGLAAADRINQVLDAPEQIQDSVEAISIHRFEQEIRFENVSFRYPNQTSDVLQNINLVIPKGKTIAIVGASGSGKTTLVDLLARFYEVREGAIKIDGINIQDLKLNDLRGLMGMVSQDPILFNDSIRNNILFGKSEVTDEGIWHSLKAAHANLFVEDQDERLDYIIGDRGIKLSGGQRQRLTIARALMRNPDILILDEATSSLDTSSEKIIQEAMSEILKDRTALIIAHRLTTIQNADQIIVLRDGQIVEQGNHDDLLKKGGEYSSFVSLQSFQLT
ncbi:MAG: ABC transporter ATP-binding protein [Saprospiraceae bacterium]|nr:ABC transporter ATP-binding protein [Saprospiraceae bacterium]